MAIRNRVPLAAGAYNPPNSGASNTGEAGATDGELPVDGNGGGHQTIARSQEIELASVGAPHRPLTAAGRNRTRPLISGKRLR